ncbi:MAG TPA: acyl-CoA dehydrogenase family protein [Acidimicrobiales bacterium]|nr:acyl-CoA dehydrogenase family protein [Acidimicrobiales bacterium]
MIEQPGRQDLARWLDSRPTNYYEATPNLRSVLDIRAGVTRTASMEPRLRDFGRVVAEVIDPAVETLERHRELPAHIPYDGIGRRVDQIEFHPDYQRAGQAVWASEILAVNRGGRGAFEQAALFYLLAHAGEGGHSCPVVCTAGLARAVERRGSPELNARYASGLFEIDYDRCLRGSQFLTEVQGGSDVGANVTRAVPDATEPGAWRITGEKWFCSVADADLFAVTARPDGAGEGTGGLGCFLVPRSLDGATPNGFRIRRLKDKLGTRCLASAEIDFDGALGWPIGGVEEGFRVAVEELLNTSRWLNAVGSTALMRRAYLEASSFARHRQAFGQAVESFRAVRGQLAVMKVEEQAALASTMALTGLLDDVDSGQASEPEVAVYRLLVNANKYLTSITATDVVHRGIEVLGGNGTIEDFSPLPRLYRDAVVFESWEGTHNVLCAQVHRDCVRLGLLDHVLTWVRGELATAGESDDGASVAAALSDLEPRLRRALTEPEGAGAHFRRHLDQLTRVVQASCLLSEAVKGADAEKRAVVALFVRLHLIPGHRPEEEPGWHELVEAVLGDATAG